MEEKSSSFFLTFFVLFYFIQVQETHSVDPGGSYYAGIVAPKNSPAAGWVIFTPFLLLFIIFISFFQGGQRCHQSTARSAGAS